ncbi:uncharacterized mitochondrial protein AtMg00810-like [Actinidia eriantha]|uniref:uncharacterized mitochondrial protein AtMg00810-like n=1 Tax=Actinidia eriantha TaxID=165200 RepID=UPI002589CA62|nr:uncharacterized mitochondrial protein AtMg00810-like [Actinidia eriantha]
MIRTRDDAHGISELKDFLHRHFEMNDLGPLSYFLDLEVSSGSTGYFLTQAKYASGLFIRVGILDCKTASAPLEANVCLTSLDGELLSNATLYRQLIGSLIYLTVTHPNIAHAVHLVSQFMSAPRSTHYFIVLCILRYVKGTFFIVYISPVSPLFSSMPTLMPIGLEILRIDIQPLIFTSF